MFGTSTVRAFDALLPILIAHQETWAEITGSLGDVAKTLIAGVAILLVGWLIASILGAVVRGALNKAKVDERVAHKMKRPDRAAGQAIAKGTGRGVFWLVMVFVLLAVFEVVGLMAIADPLKGLLDTVLSYVPRIVGALIIGALAVVLAKVLRSLVTPGLSAVRFDERFGGDGGPPLSKSIAMAVFWLVILLFLPAILDVLALDGLLAPVNGMMAKLLGFLPNLFAAAILLAVGWIVAKIVSQVVTNFLAAVGLDRAVDRLGASESLGGQKLSRAVGILVYVLILLPVLVAALDALALASITGPLTGMLDRMFGTVPGIIGAALILGIAYVVAKIIGGLVSALLAGIGFDAIWGHVGLPAPRQGAPPASRIAGLIVMIAIIVFASTEAAALLGFDALTTMLERFIGFGGSVLLASIILGLGLWLAGLAARAIKASTMASATFVSRVARIAIIAFAGAMALEEIGVGREIVLTAFALLLGALAIAVAIAFGVGGRDAAAKTLEGWRERMQEG